MKSLASLSCNKAAQPGQTALRLRPPSSYIGLPSGSIVSASSPQNRLHITATQEQRKYEL